MKTERKPIFSFTLYICGDSPRSARVISTLKTFCAEKLDALYKIKIIDIQKHPEMAKEKNIVACPTLIKTNPLPPRTFIGSLVDTGQILQALGLT